jgi:hypothetical protein
VEEEIEKLIQSLEEEDAVVYQGHGSSASWTDEDEVGITGLKKREWGFDDSDDVEDSESSFSLL